MPLCRPMAFVAARLRKKISESAGSYIDGMVFITPVPAADKPLLRGAVQTNVTVLLRNTAKRTSTRSVFRTSCYPPYSARIGCSSQGILGSECELPFCCCAGGQVLLPTLAGGQKRRARKIISRLRRHFIRVSWTPTSSRNRVDRRRPAKPPGSKDAHDRRRSQRNGAAKKRGRSSF
jgi:hypothetical protein